ncbi:CII family transcriptional regulator [Bordetella avium]|uniref:CII family transcriptional regulator n=1 Tax=Bordetella avium TaxID=521 RepID=UPI000E0C7EE5|nr:CII family transcriptional regulator [Bordetella avium]RIQ58914.1 MarR family transcriptional regulator [Bordetella avium]WQE34257.1 CII family transcriptional regulator [Bordetella avium]SUV67850.1 phage regulatory protein [Bordetella avium]
MNEQAVSDEQRAMVSNIGARLQAEVLQRLAAITQKHAAECMGVHPSKVSRMVSEDLMEFCCLLAAAGFQLTTGDSVVMDQNEQIAIESMALKWMQARHQARLETVRQKAK